MNRRRNCAAPLPDAAAVAPLVFRYDPALPIHAHRAAILELLRIHPVLIVAGDTGSGKSTQLPQYCLEIGRGGAGLIAHTQPRRIAARALAARIAEELSQPVGGTVGFRVRFADQVSEATRLVLMTDGLLLTELTADPLLSRYDTVIVDEAHERTLNVDLLLGVLKRLRVQRPELTVIVTSATLDVDRMAHFFGGAPVVTLSGRSHPIEVRYTEPTGEAEEPDLPTAVLQACRDIEAYPGIGSGDVLVFLPGEREITDVGELLEREAPAGTEILPLYSRLAWDRQSKIFQRGAARRIVLATNVAETSITVPGIRAVIDSGLARVSRYSARNRLQRLPIEPVSRASAEQRKGRCGRLGPGLCVRLYSESDFIARAAFTEPEVLRTNLAGLLLRLAADDLGEAERFPFIDPPDPRALSDGYRLLQELGALDAERRITRRGRAMARLPLDPRLARALLESKRFRAEGELLAIVSGLSVPDARIAGTGTEAEDSVEAAAFDDTKSEFFALVKLWRAYRKAREGSRRELRRWCTERRLSLLRLSEWENVYVQVKDRAAELGIVAGAQGASYTAVHRSLLAGFCTMVATRGEEGVYLGTRGVRLHIFPGSPLKRRKPRWLMAANIVETSRVYARRVAEIEPSWIEAAAEHLVKREYLEPDWDERREAVVARERTSFLGLTLRSDRIVNYGPVAPQESRAIFAREALVYQRLTRRPDWLLANDAALQAAQRLEERLRRRDLLVPAESLVEFYARALPRQVSSAATLEYFTRRMSDADREAVLLGPEHIFAHAPDPDALAQFPESIEVGALRVDVDYRFALAERDDGATVRLPLLALPCVTRTDLDGALPGFAAPRLEALLRSLPKDARRRLIPIAETATRFVSAAGRASTDLQRLASWLQEERGIAASLIRFCEAAIAPHLNPQFAVMDAGKELAKGRDLTALRRATAAAARAALDRLAGDSYPGDWRRFELEELPYSEPLPTAQGTLQVYPALALVDGLVQVRLHWTPAEAERQCADAAVELARRMLGRQCRDLAKRVAENARLLLAASPYLRGDALVDVLLRLTLRRACFSGSSTPRTRAEFERTVDQARAGLFAALGEISDSAMGWFTAARAVRASIEDLRAQGLAELARESETHLRRLLGARTLRAVSTEWLAQLPRYLKAEERRWQRLCARGGESPHILEECQTWERRLAALEQQLLAEQRWLAQLEELAWWVEEYRVSLYAQELGTLRPVSAARLEERAAAVERWLTR